MTKAACAATAVLALWVAPAAADTYDLNGDGRQELVVGQLLNKNVSGLGVLVVSGGRGELFGGQTFLARNDLMGDRSDRVGDAVASGDFDGDGFADLAAANPDHSRDEGTEFLYLGAVTITYGAKRFPSDRTVLLEGPQLEGGRITGFGASVVAGDVNRDGFSDLLVGATSDDADVDEGGEAEGSGAVYVFFGSTEGLSWDSTARIQRANRADDAFGALLGLGDLDRDDDLDLFEGSPGDARFGDDGPVPGHLTLARGEPGGPAISEWIRGDMRGGPTSFSIGDVNGDKYPDLIVGIGTNEYAGEDDPFPSGQVMIWRGSADGPARRPITITQNTRGIPGSNQHNDLFGESVAVGRIDRDRFADIVVGAPGEDDLRGRVTVIRGGRHGFSRKGNFTLAPGVRGLPGRRGVSAGFGDDVALLRMNGDSRLDLVITGAYHRISLDKFRPSLTAIPGGRGGLKTRGAVRRTYARFGVKSVRSYGVLGRPGGS